MTPKVLSMASPAWISTVLSTKPNAMKGTMLQTNNVRSSEAVGRGQAFVKAAAAGAEAAPAPATAPPAPTPPAATAVDCARCAPPFAINAPARSANCLWLATGVPLLLALRRGRAALEKNALGARRQLAPPASATRATDPTTSGFAQAAAADVADAMWGSRGAANAASPGAVIRRSFIAKSVTPSDSTPPTPVEAAPSPRRCPALRTARVVTLAAPARACAARRILAAAR
jgi:hypothetical protein